MKKRKILEGVYWMGAIDWQRRLFDSLIPQYNKRRYQSCL